MDPSAACGDLVVILQPISRLGERQNIQLSSSSEVVSFSFSEVLPGKYKGKLKATENCARAFLVEDAVILWYKHSQGIHCRESFVHSASSYKTRHYNISSLKIDIHNRRKWHSCL